MDGLCALISDREYSCIESTMEVRLRRWSSRHRRRVLGVGKDRSAGLGAPQETGVLSYEWAPDGSALWYTRPRLRPDAERARLAQGGIVYNDRTMSAITFRNDAGGLLGTELRLFHSKSSTDELIAFAPSVPTMDLGIFRRDWGTAAWAPDSRRLLYCLPTVSDDGKRQTILWEHDVQNGRARELRIGLPVISIVPSNDGQHYLTVERHTDGYRLLQHTLAGSVAKDLGAVPYDRIGAGFGLGMWVDRAHGRTILGVHHSSHDGLATVPESAAGRALSRIVDNLSLCSFAGDLAVGACVRESLTMPPEVVAISMKDGTVTTLTKPNAHYDAIAPLRVERAHWTNRYNNRSDGYITYPRNYQPERKYPAVVVTHAADARNRFADQEFQWDFPVEVLAESGYFVLSVNEPYASLRARATVQERSRKERVNVSDAQFRLALDAVATMEAALSSLIASGAVDPRRGGIAGYSRGAEVVLYVMTQSKMFTAAAIGDGEANASSYWASGNRLSASWYRMLYGGSPYDEGPETIANYRKLSPSFRTREFAGPLLQLFAGATATSGLELHRLLQEVGVPAELVFFPNEAHLFWHPRHRAAAMQRVCDWFNSWLLGEGNHPVSASESSTLGSCTDRHAVPVLYPDFCRGACQQRK